MRFVVAILLSVCAGSAFAQTEESPEVMRAKAGITRLRSLVDAGVVPRPHVELDFEKQFGKPLPVSAMGETAVHRSLGFDHRGRVDVAIHPDQPEGRWLLEYLVEKHIPYFAFRQAVPGKATGAHIHLGPLS